MGFVACLHKRRYRGRFKVEEKQRPFKYNIKFIGAHEDEGMLDIFSSVYDGPARLLENGLSLTEVKEQLTSIGMYIKLWDLRIK